MSPHFNFRLVLPTENFPQALRPPVLRHRGPLWGQQDAYAVASGMLNQLEPELLVSDPGPQQPDIPSSATCPQQVS